MPGRPLAIPVQNETRGVVREAGETQNATGMEAINLREEGDAEGTKRREAIRFEPGSDSWGASLLFHGQHCQRRATGKRV